MERMKAWLKAVKNNRKFRCGGFSAALTAAVVACVLLVGALADALEQRFALQVDYSFNGATTQSAVTAAALEQLDKDVRLYAVVPASGGDATLLSLLNRYAAASPRVQLSFANPIRRRRGGKPGDGRLPHRFLPRHRPGAHFDGG